MSPQNPFRIALRVVGGQSWIAGVEYIKNIVAAISSLPEERRSGIQLNLICTREINQNLFQQMQPHLHQVFFEEDDFPRPTVMNRLSWLISSRIFQNLNPRMNQFLSSRRFDFVYPYFSPYCARKKIRSAAWIPDFQHKHFKTFFPASELKARDAYFNKMVRHATLVILSSQATAEEFAAFFPNAAHKARVLPFRTVAPPEWFAEDPVRFQQQYNLPDRFIIVCNQFWQHKNHLAVFEALHKLKTEGITPAVVCTGHIHDYRQPQFSDTILQTIHRLGLARQVYLLGLIPRLDQIQLMRRSAFVLQPSLFEGWSTVVEDARALGKPLLLSDIPVHVEQNPPDSIYFDKNSIENLAKQIAKCWEDFPAGPSGDSEQAAQKKSREEITVFGTQFLKIATQN
ncbi:MAG: glycosyltransferase family 4 protein [Thermodesulfobacteriota bacterium]